MHPSDALRGVEEPLLSQAAPSEHDTWGRLATHDDGSNSIHNTAGKIYAVALLFCVAIAAKQCWHKRFTVLAASGPHGPCLQATSAARCMSGCRACCHIPHRHTCSAPSYCAPLLLHHASPHAQQMHHSWHVLFPHRLVDPRRAAAVGRRQRRRRAALRRPHPQVQEAVVAGRLGGTLHAPVLHSSQNAQRGESLWQRCSWRRCCWHAGVPALQPGLPPVVARNHTVGVRGRWGGACTCLTCFGKLFRLQFFRLLQQFLL